MIKRAKTTVEVELTPREIAEVIIDMTCDEQVDVLRDLADCHTFHRADFVMQLKYIVEALEKLPPTNKRRIKGMFDSFVEYDVVEARHGHWFKDEKFYHDIMVDGNPVCLFHTCSVCGVADEYITVNERPDGRHAIVRSIRKYCPNCGARMEREWGGANENKNN